MTIRFLCIQNIERPKGVLRVSPSISALLGSCSSLLVSNTSHASDPAPLSLQEGQIIVPLSLSKARPMKSGFAWTVLCIVCGLILFPVPSVGNSGTCYCNDSQTSTAKGVSENDACNNAISKCGIINNCMGDGYVCSSKVKCGASDVDREGPI